MIAITDVTANTRELIVQLSRGKRVEARVLAERVGSDLSQILASGPDRIYTSMHEVQQTKFALDEVLLLVDQNDMGGALDAARDAAKEWRALPKSQE